MFVSLNEVISIIRLGETETLNRLHCRINSEVNEVWVESENVSHLCFNAEALERTVKAPSRERRTGDVDRAPANHIIISFQQYILQSLVLSVSKSLLWHLH